MLKLSLPVVVLLLLLLSSTRLNAFVVIPTAQQPQQQTRLQTTTQLHAASIMIAEDRIKGAGAGLPLHPAGDRHLFDPAVQGKLQGTNALNDRIHQGASYHYLAPEAVTATADTAGADAEAPPAVVVLDDAQHWLEDIGVPVNTVKPTNPVQATVLGRASLITDDAPGDIQHIVLKLPEGMHYVEGQSLSVIPPGLLDTTTTTTTTTTKPHKPRLYSIASTRYGDLLDGQTVSLCVRRAVYTDPATGQVDDSKKGVCSNFLCDCQPGDIVQVAGPVGKTMLLPEDPTKDIIMVATGTGIAPFRGFLHRLFMENTVARHMFTGKAWLILGVPVTGGLLYHEEFQAMQAQARAQAADRGGSKDDDDDALEVTYAISREMTNAAGGKLYVQDVLAERADELFDKLLNHGAVIYFCGLKGMMPGILEALEKVAVSKGMDWSATLKQLKANNQWHVEVY